jgi:hypothetical protein
MVSIAAIFSKREYKTLLAFLVVVTFLQTYFYYFDFMVYRSAFIADFIILYAAVREKNKFSLKIALVSLGFMLSHLYGYLIYLAYVKPDSYDNCLSCLYVILLLEIMLDGGAINGLKRLVEYCVHDIVNRARIALDLYEVN